MTHKQPDNKKKTNAVFNIVAGILFFIAAFNLLTGQGGFDWLSLVAGILFMVAGVWGLMRQ